MIRNGEGHGQVRIEVQGDYSAVECLGNAVGGDEAETLRFFRPDNLGGLVPPVST